MDKDRLVAFTDGVIAVIITIMVLELKAPTDTSLASLIGLWPIFLSYVLSFIYVGIYWNNHHHFFQLIDETSGGILWANLNLLFWISLIPFTTAWVGEHETAPWPTALYGASLLMSAVAWYILQATVIRKQGTQSALRQAIGRDLKGKTAPALYLVGVGLAFVNTILADVVYAGVAMMWLVPDRRIERHAALSPTD